MVASITEEWQRKYLGYVVTIVAPSLYFPGAWEVSPRPINQKGRECDVLDCRLRPIRPDEGQDETLRWLDVPNKEKVFT